MTHDDALAKMAQRFARGTLPPLEEQALRAHLRGCPGCRARYDRYALAEAAVEGDDPYAPPDAQLERMLALGAPRPRRAGRLGWPIAAAAALLLGVGAWLALRAPTPGEWTARGADGGGGAWIRVFTRHGTAARPMGAAISTRDGLLFAYSIERDAPYRHLAIAGRDARGRAHWFHPAFTDPDARPESLTVEAGVADRELPDAVFVEPAPGPLEICGLFTREPLAIRTVDAALEAGSPWPAAHRHCVTVEVQP